MKSTLGQEINGQGHTGSKTVPRLFYGYIGIVKLLQSSKPHHLGSLLEYGLKNVGESALKSS